MTFGSQHFSSSAKTGAGVVELFRVLTERIIEHKKTAKEEAPRKKRKPTGGLECQLGFMLGVGLLAASRLGQLWIAFDVFAHFTLQFAVVTLGFLVGMLMPRAKLLAAFVVMVIGIVGIGRGHARE